MRELLLIRHAKSSRDDLGCPDRDRPLNGRGKSEAPAMGKRLACLGICPERILVSPAKRARQTAARIAAALDIGKKRLEEWEILYSGTIDDILGWLRWLPDRTHLVALIGHQPMLGELLHVLTGRSPAELPTCAGFHLVLDIDSWRGLGPTTGRVAGRYAPAADAACQGEAVAR